MNFKKSNSVNYLSIITLSLLASYELKAADAFEPSELEGLWTFDNACEIDASGMCQARTFSITDHCDVLEGTETNYVERDANGANDYSGACNHGEFSGRSNALPDGNYRYYDTSPPNIGLATATISSVNFFGQDFKILDFAPMESQVEGYPSEPTTLAFNMRLDARIFKRIMVNDDLDKDTSGMLWPNNGCVLDNVLGKTSADTFSFSELICHDNPLMVLGSENYIRIDLIPTCEDPSDGCQGQSTTGEIQATIKLGDEQPLRLAYDLYTDTEATFSFDALPAWFEESHHIAVSYYPMGIENSDGTFTLQSITVALMVDGEIRDRAIKRFDKEGDEEEGSEEEGNDNKGISLENSQLNLFFGNAVDESNNDVTVFIGMLDNVRLYRRALSSKEIACIASGKQFCITDTPITRSAIEGLSGLSVTNIKLIESAADCVGITQNYRQQAIGTEVCQVGGWAIEAETDSVGTLAWYWVGAIKGDSGAPERSLGIEKITFDNESNSLEITRYRTCADNETAPCTAEEETLAIKGPTVQKELPDNIYRIMGASLNQSGVLNISRINLLTDEEETISSANSLIGRQGEAGVCQNFSGNDGLSVTRATWVPSSEDDEQAGSLVLYGSENDIPIRTIPMARGGVGNMAPAIGNECPDLDTLNGINGSKLQTVEHDETTGDLAIEREVFARSGSSANVENTFVGLIGEVGEDGPSAKVAGSPDQVFIESDWLTNSDSIPVGGTETHNGGFYQCQYFVSKALGDSQQRRYLKKCILQ